MARDTDRKQVSEAARKSNLWRITTNGEDYVTFNTDYAEHLWVRYGKAGQILHAVYIHFDEHGNTASRELYHLKKRKHVLHHLNQKDTKEDS